MSVISDNDRAFLLTLARHSIEKAVCGEELDALDLAGLPEALQQEGASFVTLTLDGDLRGCIGALEAYQPLALDVREHALAAAFEDYRFPPVNSSEAPRLKIEISILSRPERLDYSRPDELPGKLRPGIDGVILRDGIRRATFLPQVWEKISSAEEFLGHLCQKMGAAYDFWKRKKMEVWTYQVEEFHE